jgi:DNA-binding LacI/PurR family transcriptional regulator
MAKKVTLQDVANLANVAQGTASQALNNKSGVSAAWTFDNNK